MKKLLSILLLVLLGIVVSCSTDDGIDGPNGGGYTIIGSVQKGPFVLGSTINIQSLNGKLNPTGQSYTTSTNDDAGHFDLGSNLSNKYAEIIATGYYFDEVVGDLSQGTLTLRSITDLEDGETTNVNLLTTLIYNRTQNLVKNSGKSVADATTQAERELFVAMGIESSDIPDIRCSKMDISQAGDHNALLLTISVALQYNRSTAALSELVAKLATDLADDGHIASDKIRSLYIRKSVDNLASQVRSNLIYRYNQLGAQNNVPHFDKYLGYFLDINGNGVADKVDFAILDENSAEFSAKGGEYTLPLSYVELDNSDFVLSEGAEKWLTLNTDSGVCQLSVDYNTTTETRNAEIIIKERGGDRSLTFYVSQQASFHVEFTCDSGANVDNFSFTSDVEHFTTEINEGNGILLLTSAPSYIEQIAGPFISITIPECVEYFNTGAFSECDTLKEFKGKWASDDGRYLADGTELLYYITTGLADFIIPQNITTIGSSAFYGSTMSCTVTIPANVTTIKDCAFADCNNVPLFKFESMTPPTLDRRAFEGTYPLQISVPKEAVEAYLTCDWPYDYRRAIIELADIKIIPDNYRIYYTTNDNQRLNIQFGLDYIIISHIYTDGIGVIEFSEPLTMIGYKLFSGCSSLTSVTIPDSVTTIESSAFSGCSSLVNVTIPDGVTSIGGSAFYNCSNLKSVAIPDSVTTIGGSVFSGCSSLESVTIGNGVTTIGMFAFLGCGSLTSVYISDIAAWCNISFSSSDSNPLYNGCNLYLNNELVTDLIIPNSVTTIGDYAFVWYSSLTSVTIGDSVTTIGNYAFDWCSSLTSVTIPDSVTTIGSSAFSSCSSLTSVTIPDSVTTIGSSAFSSCSRLTSVTIPDSVTSIGSWAFRDCSSLTSITIPDSVTTIGEGAFFACSSLTSVTIGDSVTTIGDGAFLGCGSLTSVTIPDSVTSIGSWAFQDCSNLTSVTIPDSVTTIGDLAFYNCSRLTSVTIPNSVTTIGEGAFEGCSSLTSVTIPNSVTKIGEGAFSYCSRLTSVYCKAATPPVGNWDMFEGNTSDRKIYVPMESVEAYKSASYWKNYADDIVGYNF
ncbi:MAG: leucine-rich repeat protein [Alistipes sp.]|nr:leucine-rich repeat protein [Alistipes sp.]